MASGFAQKSKDKLNALLAILDGFLVETEFVYKIADLDRAQASDPALDTGNWEKMTRRTLRRDQGVTWVRADFIVPETCLDVAVRGSELRVMTESGNAMFAPLEVYVDGKLVLSERSWMDFKCPEAVITASAEPGRRHHLAFRFDLRDKCYWLNEFSLKIVCDRVEQSAMHIRSIVEELGYMGEVPGTEETLQEAYARLGAAAETESVGELRRAEEECRALFEPFRAQVKKNRVYLVGHAHIDMNWFWSMEETRSVVKRDFTTMLRLMERYPEFKFSQSQCATYQIAREDCPDVYREMTRRAREGRWDVTASTWVEGDLNMAQGESIVRHMLTAKNALKEDFGRFPRIMWCPDTFGHPATVPQILKKSGLSRYYHMRCGLGVGSHEDTGFPLLEDSRQTPVYWWIGPDGSRVLALNTVYNRKLDTRGILRASRRVNAFGVDKAMLTYGVGDHGGGPTIRDIEWVRTIQNYPTTPEIVFSTTDEYCRAIEAGGYSLPERRGEMNYVFEGCYTTHADAKRGNRLCEEKLAAVEGMCLMARPYGFEYPAEALEGLWRRTLFNQFHDIFDGSGVKDTYKFTSAEYADILSKLDLLEESAGRAIAGAQGGTHAVINPLGETGAGVVRIDTPEAGEYEAFGPNGEICPCQSEPGRVLVSVKDVPPMGVWPVTLRKAQGRKEETMVSENERYYLVNTPLYEIEICKDNGQITTLYDRALDWYVVRREEIGWRAKKGVLNVLQAHLEEPTEMSGWTIGNVRTVMTLASGAKSEVISAGPVQARIRFTHSLLDSVIRQDLVIDRDSPVLRFETRVDWKEWGDFDRDAPMLKVYCAPDVKNTCAVYDIPFGTVERPCVDQEVPALQWADIADEKHGFALLNDCKYGYRCRGNGMELTLIRSGWLPDQKSDIGLHEFTYAFLPHAGDWREGGVRRAARLLNRPMRVFPAQGGTGVIQSLMSTEGALLSGVKRAEDGNGLIVRLINETGAAADAVLKTGFDVQSAQTTGLLEDGDGQALAISGREISVPLKKYEILSVRIIPQ